MFKKILLGTVLVLASTLTAAAVEANKASEAELDAVKGIGPATSRIIISERKKSDFKNWEDLMSRVKGIGGARAARLSEQGLTVAGQPYKPMVTATQPKSAKAAEEKAKK